MGKNEESYPRQVKVARYSQIEVYLGKFVDNDLPKGYSVEVSPDHFDEDTVTTEVVTFTDGTQTKMYLFVLNSSDQPVLVTINRL